MVDLTAAELKKKKRKKGGGGLGSAETYSS